MAVNTPAKADILEVISNLSNDEVFTPPKVVNAVLDLLPAEVWTDPELRWLDPGTKTGVFLREVTRRLMVGLEEAISDDTKRLEHILKNMVFGIAITELTSLMARRSLYCSKDASGEESLVAMPTSAGHVWFERPQHSFNDQGRCQECGASDSQLERGENRENYAYGFIHEAARKSIEKEIGMNFDVIVGNPPYQMDSDGGTRTMPLYQLFVDQAKELNPRYIAMITPSRWMAGGLGLDEFRKSMLGDDRVRKIVDFPNASEVFPGVEIKGGVGYFLWDRDTRGLCDVAQVRGEVVVGPESRRLNEYDVLVRDARALAILEKVLKAGGSAMTEIVATNNEFGIGTNFSGFHASRGVGRVKLHLVRGGARAEAWIDKADIPRGQDQLSEWKVLIPKSGSDGGQRLPDVVLGRPQVVKPPCCSTQTFVYVRAESEAEARSIESYVRTRFLRFLISLRKISQHAPRQTYLWAPQQSWDREWTDQALYSKYRITQEEQEYIAEMVKEMPA